MSVFTNIWMVHITINANYKSFEQQICVTDTISHSSGRSPGQFVFVRRNNGILHVVLLCATIAGRGKF